MLPETYVDIAPHLSRRQNVLWASSDPRINAYYRRYESELPRHSFKVVVPVIGETVTIKNRDRDVRQRRRVPWHELIHNVRHGTVKKIKFRHRLGNPHHVDFAFDVIMNYLGRVRRHLAGTVMRTNVMPFHWEFASRFLRLFTEARAIHVKNQEQVTLTYADFEYALQPIYQPKVFSMEARGVFFWISSAASAPRFSDWFLAPSIEDRFVRIFQGTAAIVDVARLLHERVLLQDLPVFNRCILVVHLDPINWMGITPTQHQFMHDITSRFPKPNPRTGVQFHCSVQNAYVVLHICPEEEAGH
ncbi:hypothetical protein AAVH_14818 [Aphelenchoides avenae]|nr:hypothetical protein AAVH_14818 [Aphelenchus avenae]